MPVSSVSRELPAEEYLRAAQLANLPSRLDTRGRWSITCITTIKFCDTHANDLARNMMTCELPMLFLDYRIHRGGGGAASGVCSAHSSLHQAGYRTPVEH